MTADALLESRGAYWLLFALAMLLFATANLPWQLDDYDQAKQAFTSFEMIEQGHWSYQHTPNGAIATKPPLVGWISAGVFVVTRSWQIAWRLPSLLAAAAVFVLIGRAAGPAASLVASSAFAFNLLALRIATLVRTDMPLTLAVFLIGAQIWGKLRDRSEWTTRDRVIAFALLSAAMLIKGPIVYAFLLPGIVVFQLLRTRVVSSRLEPSHPRAEIDEGPSTALGNTNRGCHAISAWCGWWPWLASLAVFLVWLGAGIWRVPEFLELVVIREFGGRFEGTHAAQPVWFYVVHLLAKFAPWSILIAFFAILLRRTKPAAETLWLICWSVGAVIVMSLIPSKRVDRIFPVVPPLCLLLAAQFQQLRERRWCRVATMVTLVIAVVAVGAYSASKIATAYRHHRNAYVQFADRVLAIEPLRFAVIGGEDEGLLLYLRKSQFSLAADAIDAWRRGEIDAIVAPDDELPLLIRSLPGATQSTIGISGRAGAHGNRYALLVRK